MTRDQFLSQELNTSWLLTFHDWAEFGILWEWSKRQEWFVDWFTNKSDAQIISMINPNRFADSIAEYLGWDD